MKLTATVPVLLALAACSGTPKSPGVESAVLQAHDVQGAGAVSPLTGASVRIAGVVSAVFADGGMALQALQPDDDPETSEGLYVSLAGGSSPAGIGPGDRVEADGVVTEVDGETRLQASQVRVTGHAPVAPAMLQLPADLERFEGMRVRIPHPLYIQDLYELQRYGSLRLGIAPRLEQFTNVQAPSVSGYRAWLKQRARDGFLLDDGLRGDNRQPPRYLHPQSARPDWSPRVGDEVQGVDGVLRFVTGSDSGGTASWRLMPVAAPVFTALNPRVAAPDTGGTLTVASFNVLNFFTTLDDGTTRCGPDRSLDCRGANTAVEFARQRARTLTALRGLGADVVGLMELENNPDTAIRSLVDGLNECAGCAHRWAYIDTGTVGTDAIRVAFVYRRDRVEPVGNFAILDATVDTRFHDHRNRPALAQTFRELRHGGVFTVAVNHLKSKGSPCTSDGDPDTGDGQGNCNRTRVLAAMALADWLDGDPTASGDPDRLIIGDLNAYLYEDPLTTLEQAGFVNLLKKRGPALPYSFVYRAASGALDHALASPSLAAQVRAVAEWHINADEAPLFDYNLEFGREASWFDPAQPWRASDHDPLLVGLALHAD